MSIFRAESEEKEMPNPRRESLGNIQNFLKTLAYWKKGPSSSSEKKTEPKPRTVERSKSFSIKCDKGYSTYYQIEPKRKNSPGENSYLNLQPQNNNNNPFSNFHEVGLPLPPISNVPPAKR